MPRTEKVAVAREVILPNRIMDGNNVKTTTGMVIILRPDTAEPVDVAEMAQTKLAAVEERAPERLDALIKHHTAVEAAVEEPAVFLAQMGQLADLIIIRMWVIINTFRSSLS
jgi:hypothetical protein